MRIFGREASHRLRRVEAELEARRSSLPSHCAGLQEASKINRWSSMIEATARPSAMCTRKISLYITSTTPLTSSPLASTLSTATTSTSRLATLKLSLRLHSKNCHCRRTSSRGQTLRSLTPREEAIRRVPPRESCAANTLQSHCSRSAINPCNRPRTRKRRLGATAETAPVQPAGPVEEESRMVLRKDRLRVETHLLIGYQSDQAVQQSK